MSFFLPLILAATVTSEIPRLEPAEVASLTKKGDAVVIDVRGSVPYEYGHVSGSIWMPLGMISQRAAELPDDKTIVSYCTCKAEETSLAAARLLQSLGFSRLAVMRGGYAAWVAAQLPIESNREPGAETAPASAVASANGRLAPPAAVSCSRDKLTAFAGSVSEYRRQEGKTTVTIETSSGTKETVVLEHPGTDDPSKLFLIEGSSFGARHWSRIEKKPGELLPGMSAIGWVCQGGASLVDWRPGVSYRGAE